MREAASQPGNRLRRVRLAKIRQLARQIAQKFHPQRIILFGSYAYGKPHKDSDVDILVVMAARNETTQACRIRLAIDHLFPMDLIVRTPANLRWRLQEGDWFLREIMDKGKTLYEEANSRVDSKGRRRLCRRPKTRDRKAAAS